MLYVIKLISARRIEICINMVVRMIRCSVAEPMPGDYAAGIEAIGEVDVIDHPGGGGGGMLEAAVDSHGFTPARSPTRVGRRAGDR